MAPMAVVAPPVESTPLIKNDKAAAPPDEENGIPSARRPEQPQRRRRWRRKDGESASAGPGRLAFPSWSQAFAEVSPFLRPRDRRHAFLALLALLLVTLEKLIGVLPPLAIRHAVDAISAFGSADGDLGSYSEARRRTASAVTGSIAAYFLLRTLDASVSSLQSVAQRAVSLDAERRFAARLFAHLHRLGAAYHLERHAGELLRVLSRGSDATSTIIDALWFNLAPTFFEAAVVGTVFWKLLGIPSIAFTTITSVALFLIYTVKVTGTRMKQRRDVLDRSEDVGRIETETLVNYETVVMFGREGREVEEYDVARKDYTDARVRMLGLFAWLQIGQQTIQLAGVCAGLWLAGRATVYGVGGGGGKDDLLSPGSFVVVQLYIQQLFNPLAKLGFTYRQLTDALTDLEKAVKMLRSKPLVVDAEEAVEWDVALEQRQKMDGRASESAASGDITFDNVSFWYKVKSRRKKLGGPEHESGGPAYGGGGKGGRRGFGRRGLWGGKGRGMWTGHGRGNFWIKDAKKEEDAPEDVAEDVEVGGIENVSFNIPAGKTAALVGPSGSGKTTIVRLILRMYDPDEGSVKVDKIDVKSLLQQSLRSNIGVVAQDTVLFHASLRDNIVCGKEDATEEEIREAVKISALESLVDSLPEGLETLVGERGMKLSGGERQRVGLARCVIKRPKLVLLDEATSALDSGTERQIQRNILTPQTAAAVCRGRTTLMIAHRLSTARRADVILVLDNGRIVERGTHGELLALGAERGMYARMWRDQMEGETLDELK